MKLRPRAFFDNQIDSLKNYGYSIGSIMRGAVGGIDVLSVITAVTAIKDDGIMISFS